MTPGELSDLPQDVPALMNLLLREKISELDHMAVATTMRWGHLLRGLSSGAAVPRCTCVERTCLCPLRGSREGDSGMTKGTGNRVPGTQHFQAGVSISIFPELLPSQDGRSPLNSPCTPADLKQ